MENRQLKLNIKQLDLRIGELSSEIKELEKNNRQGNKVGTLTSLIGLRGQLVQAYGKDSSKALIELDRQIDDLTVELSTCVSDDIYQTKLKDLEDLSKVRCQLAESKVKQSHAPALISGLFGISAVLLVLNYEKKDIVTSKAYALATSLFRGN